MQIWHDMLWDRCEDSDFIRGENSTLLPRTHVTITKVCNVEKKKNHPGVNVAVGICPEQNWVRVCIGQWRDHVLNLVENWLATFSGGNSRWVFLIADRDP
jgi:hypothetical protein